ncbi:two-component system response regulator [Blastomonas marina]|uniref:Two-component system response regulator n=1 Tax=Blastomonas marina TaxID=1867408 RepID=A0ABQ1F6I2_9SPHN|nr:response regulator [Blastomonas marina]GGA00101.1 two-component system response regulator [Blastomonas marina]
MAYILAADDDEMLGEVIRRRLSESGHYVAMCGDGAELLARLSEGLPDLILLDQVMPGRSGMEVLITLKRDPLLVSIPVVMLTACKAPADVLAALRAGAADYITKPFIPDELALRVDGLLLRRQADLLPGEELRRRPASVAIH